MSNDDITFKRVSDSPGWFYAVWNKQKLGRIRASYETFGLWGFYPRDDDGWYHSNSMFTAGSVEGMEKAIREFIIKKMKKDE